MIARLPLQTALIYGLFFAIAFWFYTASWVTGPIMASDSPEYLSTGQRLLNFQTSELRTPGYPLLIVLAGSAQSPNRTLFFVSPLLHFVSIWLLASVLYCAGLRKQCSLWSA